MEKFLIENIPCVLYGNLTNAVYICTWTTQLQRSWTEHVTPKV